MIKYFTELHNTCHLIIDGVLTSQDIQSIKDVFQQAYNVWHIEFIKIDSVDKSIVDMLYTEIYDNKKNIQITTHKNKLNSYFHRLGFTTKFDSLIKHDVIKVSSVNTVLIGGSADSSNKIVAILKSNNFENLCLVIVQHVQEDKKGMFDTILQKYTSAKVKYAEHGESLKLDTIYLAPNNKHLLVENASVYLSDAQKYNFSRPSISLSYESFSNYYKDKLLVIQECGYASDGVDKMEILKKNKTKIIIQNEDECEAKSMVRNALELEVHDYYFKLEKIIEYIQFLNRKFAKGTCIKYLFEAIYRMYGYDFRRYNVAMLQRRLDIFMIKHSIKILKDAVGLILFNQRVFKDFFLEVSINVTELFRKPKSFQTLSNVISKSSTDSNSLKIWSAGCSSGEEVYSIAILLDNLGILDTSIIYATDFNDVVLKEAENGLYALKHWKKAENNYKKLNMKNNLDKYFVKNKHYVTINDRIKKNTLFFRHNLGLDSSFNEFDIIMCKNVIIYFDVALQESVFKLFYDSLKKNGYLVLGESEMLPSGYLNLFEQCSNDCKIFRKIV